MPWHVVAQPTEARILLSTHPLTVAEAAKLAKEIAAAVLEVRAYQEEERRKRQPAPLDIEGLADIAGELEPAPPAAAAPVATVARIPPRAARPTDELV